MRVLDYDGLSYFWENLKAYIGVNVKSVNTRVPNINGDVTVAATHIHYCNEASHLMAQDVQNAIDELDVNLNYNAIYEFDATLTAAPPNLPRGYNWHVDMDAPLEGEYYYRRFFYSSLEDSLLDTELDGPNKSAAVAAWVISGGEDGVRGRRVTFEYWKDGNIINTVELTSPDGSEIWLPRYRPIPVGDVWFFGAQQGADQFPTDDTIRSILDINVEGIWLHMGNPLELTTTNPEIVGAINEINAKQASVRVIKAGDAAEAKQISEDPENKDAFVYVAREVEP